MEVPQRDAGCHLDVARVGVEAVRGEADGRADLKVPEDGDAGLRVDDGGVGGERRRGAAAAHAEELDLRHDEAVPAAVLAHVAVQVGESAQVLDLPVVAFDAHASVPAVEGLDEADDTAETTAVDELRVVVCVV